MKLNTASRAFTVALLVQSATAAGMTESQSATVDELATENPELAESIRTMKNSARFESSQFQVTLEGTELRVGWETVFGP